MFNQHGSPLRLLPVVALLLFASLAPPSTVRAQDYVTGAFDGQVKDTEGNPVPKATVIITNKQTGVPVAKQTNDQGRFYQGVLQPGIYVIHVEKQGFQTADVEQPLFATKTNPVVPVPITLKRETTTAATATPTPTGTQLPVATASPLPTVTPTPAQGVYYDEGEAVALSNTDIAADINTRDARRDGAFSRKEVSTLPLGATTLIRTFDELALLLPGITAPPQTLGDVAGPGVGAGVGSAGQFSANGMRSRSNNFTVDGSDNNDEDIGVRRQGFLSLVPQPIESIREYQVITLLAPAQYGRNVGAQVNAVSRSGGNRVHGVFYGFLNTREMNARNTFDTTFGNATFQLRSGSPTNQPVFLCNDVNFNVPGPTGTCIGQRPLTVTNQSGGKDSFSLLYGGFAFGGPIKKDKMFFFVSAEHQRLNATKEHSFAVPTVAQRGAFRSGATGLFFDPVERASAFAFPTALRGDAIFSLYPFPNNPNGVYGENTFTQVLPASGRGTVFSAKTDNNFKAFGRQQSFTIRYNITNDGRDLPVTGEAIFSTLHPRVRTQNLSTFLNTDLSGANSTNPVFNQLRLSYGRTRLAFDEVRDRQFLVPSDVLPRTPFLLNAPILSNFTLPNLITGAANTGPVFFIPLGVNTENSTIGTGGQVGQVAIAGFSPLGVDVFNFPQSRVNNTYQAADTVSWRVGAHNFAFGTDIRRTELNSALARNARPLITFGGAPLLRFPDVTNPNFRFGGFVRPEDLAAAGAPTSFAQSIATNGEAGINLRYYQYNFFAQDEWRVSSNLSFSLGLRYEYNTPPRETSGRIESTFNSSALSLVPGLRTFIAGRSKIFDSDKNNFAPRVGVAYSPKWFGPDRMTVFRAGYGIFYDQILGAVVSQSRNVFPTYLTVDLPGGAFGSLAAGGTVFDLLNPSDPLLQLVTPNTLNTLDRSFTLQQQINFITSIVGFNVFGATLPARSLKTPMAHQYDFTFEQQMGKGLVFSAAYVGTQGKNLLRFTTPNLGPNSVILPIASLAGADFVPEFFGVVFEPGTTVSSTGNVISTRPGGRVGRPTAGVGSVNIFESTASSRYDALQLQLRGRFNMGGFLSFLGTSQFQANYTYSKANDDVSDVFGLAGAPALPQDSLTFAGERAPANFDTRHRFSYSYVTDLPEPGTDRSKAFRLLFGGIQLAGTGIFQTGQPFTVNSIFDVNLDGNLTDRLNSLSGLIVTGDRARPLALAAGTNPTNLLAPIGQDGAIPRNSFRASNLWLTNVAIVKKFRFTENESLQFRMDVFNAFNRANYGIPVRFLEAPGFGRATDTVTPGRRIQFALKLEF